jgi:hypothetical protein
MYNLCVQLIFMEKLCTQLDVYRKNYAYNLLLEKKIYTQVIFQVVMHTSCTHKFAPIKLYA